MSTTFLPAPQVRSVSRIRIESQDERQERAGSVPYLRACVIFEGEQAQSQSGYDDLTDANEASPKKLRKRLNPCALIAGCIFTECFAKSRIRKATSQQSCTLLQFSALNCFRFFNI